MSYEGSIKQREESIKRYKDLLKDSKLSESRKNEISKNLKVAERELKSFKAALPTVNKPVAKKSTRSYTKKKK